MLNGVAMKTIFIIFIFLFIPVQVFADSQGEKPSFEQFIRENAIPSREAIERFIRDPVWSQFDSELGYIQGNYTGAIPVAIGIDGSATTSTLQSNGARTSFVYPDIKPRINTYGDSITQCNQVNDSETWQEYLGGHIGEPIRNFGVGGYGVYQAYRRMIREEKTDHGAKYLILTICCDDSTRSLYRDRFALIALWGDDTAQLRNRELFGLGVPWPNVEMDLKTGRFVENNNPLPTTELLYHMAEPDWMIKLLKDDLALQLMLYQRGAIRDLDRKQIGKLATLLDFSFDWKNEASLQSQAEALLNRYSQRATIFVLDKARAFARQNGKKLLIVLNLTTDWTEMKRGGSRDDQEVLNYLVKERFDYVDMNEVHLRDFRKYDLSWSDYVLMKQYAVNGPNGPGHYSPQGNHFIAYSLKDKVVEWLDPKPESYKHINAQK